MARASRLCGGGSAALGIGRRGLRGGSIAVVRRWRSSPGPFVRARSEQLTFRRMEGVLPESGFGGCHRRLCSVERLVLVQPFSCNVTPALQGVLLRSVRVSCGVRPPLRSGGHSIACVECRKSESPQSASVAQVAAHSTSIDCETDHAPLSASHTPIGPSSDSFSLSLDQLHFFAPSSLRPCRSEKRWTALTVEQTLLRT